jgi:hypothetical protein
MANLFFRVPVSFFQFRLRFVRLPIGFFRFYLQFALFPWPFFSFIFYFHSSKVHLFRSIFSFLGSIYRFSVAQLVFCLLFTRCGVVFFIFLALLFRLLAPSGVFGVLFFDFRNELTFSLPKSNGFFFHFFLSQGSPQKPGER